MGTLRVCSFLLCLNAALPAADFPRIFIHNFNVRPPMPADQIEALAQRDLVILSPIFRRDYKDIAAIRKLNPQIVILQYALTYQVAYDDRGQLSNDDEVAIFRDHPESWLATAQPATVAKSVGPEDRRIELSTSLQEKLTRRFLPVILCGAELMRVERVDGTAIEVSRGRLGTAVRNHPAGAAVSIVAQPPSWTTYYRKLTPESEVVDINISDQAPRMNGKRPWELKADFLIRSWADPQWRKAFDGFFLDEGQVPPGGMERGERLLAKRLRERCGDDLVLVFNNQDIVIRDASGRHREHFVDMPRFPNWSYSMEPLDAWSELGHPPTAVLNSSQPGTWNDYRQVRFGLASALVYGGYYQYRAESGDHGNWKYWFDEYSVDGRRHWLGKPLGPARQIVHPVSTPNRMVRAFWDITASADLDQQGDALRATVSKPEAAVLSAPGTGALAAETEYTLSFAGRASPPRLVGVAIRAAGVRASVYLGPQWQDHVLTLFVPRAVNAFEVSFELGEDRGDVEFDEVAWHDGVAEAGWLREFEHGLVVVNPTRRAQVVEIPAGFRKIHGTQDPKHNDGRDTGRRIEVGPLDAFVLRRIPSL